MEEVKSNSNNKKTKSEMDDKINKTNQEESNLKFGSRPFYSRFIAISIISILYALALLIFFCFYTANFCIFAIPQTISYLCAARIVWQIYDDDGYIDEWRNSLILMIFTISQSIVFGFLTAYSREQYLDELFFTFQVFIDIIKIGAICWSLKKLWEACKFGKRINKIE